MHKPRLARLPLSVWVIPLSLAILFVGAQPMQAMRHKKKEKNGAVSPNDPTARLFQVLNDSFEGKLGGLYILADVYSDPSNPSQQYQRVLKVDYDKSLYFGKLAIHVRSVGKMTPDQLAIYTPKQIYDFAGSDGQVFDRINAGRFGSQTGDLYLSAARGAPPSVAEITDAVTDEYRMLVTQYILPAVEKQLAQNSKTVPAEHSAVSH